MGLRYIKPGGNGGVLGLVFPLGRVFAGNFPGELRVARLGIDALKGAVKAWRCPMKGLITNFTFLTCVGYMQLEQIVKITVGGRITIPKETMEKLGWVQGTRLRVLLDEKRVILEPAHGTILAKKAEG